ncbi:MAG: bifunctional nuclease family protein, partial [Microcystis sp. M53601_WE4]|nr:bifunctional nuclease family protein [Microcystis sp. M53601_WE4]
DEEERQAFRNFVSNLSPSDLIQRRGDFSEQ